MIKGLVVDAAALVLAGPAWAFRTPAPEGARVYIVSPEIGATVSNPVTVIFGLEGMGVAPAGVEQGRTGHHHLIIDLEPSEFDVSAPSPADDRRVDFGGGQTQVTPELPSGTHRIGLRRGDHNQIPCDPAIMGEIVTITGE